MRLAWFSPLPPVPTGVATCSRDAVAEIGKRHAIDVYVHGGDAGAPLAAVEAPEWVRVYSAHDFVWRHRAEPVRSDRLSSWKLIASRLLVAVSVRYPGLTVLHDVHVHHARAAALLRTRRADDFRREFAANHPGRLCRPGGTRRRGIRQPVVLLLADEPAHHCGVAADGRPFGAACSSASRAVPLREDHEHQVGPRRVVERGPEFDRSVACARRIQDRGRRGAVRRFWRAYAG